MKPERVDIATRLKTARSNVEEAQRKIFEMDAAPPRSAWRHLQYAVGRLAEGVDEILAHIEQERVEQERPEEPNAPTDV